MENIDIYIYLKKKERKETKTYQPITMYGTYSDKKIRQGGKTGTLEYLLSVS